MRTSRFCRGVAALTVAVALGGCGGTGSDRAGGEGTSETVVLTLAQPNHTAPAQLISFADEVAGRSDGTMRIEFAHEWRIGESDAEIGTIQDVQAGEADLAWVGARAFDRLGVASFQPLLAPLLVDSLDLQQAVFEAGIPGEMMRSLETIDLAGIGVLPGPMRKLMGVDKPYTAPDDFAGSVVGVGTSALAASTMRALGATPRDLPSGADVDGLDAMDQQLSSIVGNRYWDDAGFVTTDLNLWPRPLVIIMNSDRFTSLSDEQRDVLVDAAAGSFEQAMKDSRQEDGNAPATLCEQGMTLVVAGDDALAALRSALEPVYADIAASPGNSGWLDEITTIKADLGAPPDSAECDETTTEPTAAEDGFPQGAYQTTITADDYARVGSAVDAIGAFTLIFDDGRFEVLQPVTHETGFAGTYTVFRDRLEMTDGSDTVTATWSLDGDQLVLSSVEPAGSPFEVVMAAHPLDRVSQAQIPGRFPEGTFVGSVTTQDGIDRCDDPSFYERTLDLTIADGTLEQWETVPGRQREHGFSASYEVFRDRVVFTEPDISEPLTFRWTFDGEQLIFSDLEDDYGHCGHRVIWESHPFVLTESDSAAGDADDGLPLQGTYQWTLTDEDAIAHGTFDDTTPQALDEMYPATFTVRLDGDEWEMEIGPTHDTEGGTFTVFHDTVVFTWSGGGEVAFTYTTDADGNLTLVPQGDMEQGDVFVMSTKEWQLISE